MSEFGQGCRLAFTVGVGCRLGSTAQGYHRLGPGMPGLLFRLFGYVAPEAMLSCWLGSLPWWGYRMASRAAEVLWSGRTVGYTQQLGRTANFHPFPNWVVRGSMVITAS